MTVGVVDSGVGDAGFDDGGWGAPAGVSAEDCCPLAEATFTEEVPEAWLVAVDPSTLSGWWADAAMVAAFRADNHAAWRRSRGLWEAARASAGTTVRVTERARAGKIPAASLGWSEQRGAAKIEFARQILVRLPALGEEMRVGRLEESKAEIFVSTVADLDDAQAREVVDRLLGRAPELTHGQLRARVEATAKAVDPGWAEARLAAAIARRRVSLRTAPSGAAELSGLDLPPIPAQDAHDRIVALADVVRDRLRALGCEAGQGLVRSEVLLVLTGPDGAGLVDDDVIDLVIAHLTSPGPDHGTGDGGGGPDDGDGPDGSDDDGPDGGDDDGPDGGPDGGPDDEGGQGPDDDGHGGGPDDGGRDGDGPAGGAEAAAGGCGVPRAVSFRARVAIRLGLRTVLGLDQRPGEVPEHGSVCHSTALQLAWDHTDTESPWRLHLYDDHGHLEHLLTVRPPPTGSPDPHRRRRRRLVELTAHTRELDDLATGRAPAALGGIIGADAITLLDRATRALAAARARPPEHHPARSTADAHKRRPGAELARWVIARDHTCRGIGCERHAVSADLDHTLAWDDGGQSTADDLGPLCEADHLVKHDPTSGWTLTQPEPGVFVWTAPTGTRHLKTPEPHDPLPDPLPPADGSPFTLPADFFLPAPRVPDAYTPTRNRHGYITEPALRTADAMAARDRERRGHPPSRYDHDPDF